MANTYTLISSNVLSSSAASVTFSAIPATYTDLVLRFSARGTGGGGNNIYLDQINGTTTTIYSYTRLSATGTTAASSRATNDTIAINALMPGSTWTANSFGSFEIYLPNYAGSVNKALEASVASEDNSAGNNYLAAQAGLWRSTSAITSFRLSNPFDNIISGSSFYLYGIKNS
jgi:hypothetical protein